MFVLNSTCNFPKYTGFVVDKDYVKTNYSGGEVRWEGRRQEAGSKVGKQDKGGLHNKTKQKLHQDQKHVLMI